MLGAVAALALATIVLAGRSGMLDMTAHALAEAIRDLGPAAAGGAVAAMVLHSFVPLPAEVIAMANGMVFGPLLGLVLTWVGAMAGAIVAFALARRLGRPFVARLVPERHWHRIDAWTAESSAGALLMARLVPVISFNLINYAAGLTGVPWRTFLWTTAIGILPVTAACVFLGERLLTAPVWVWLALAAAMAALWWGMHRWRARARASCARTGADKML
ncbi:MAG: TVP38/TMEM64 family protein [Azospirillaceae bacterium]